MQQNAKFIRKLPIPMDIKKEFPVTEEVAKVREARVEEMRAILDAIFSCIIDVTSKPKI